MKQNSKNNNNNTYDEAYSVWDTRYIDTCVTGAALFRTVFLQVCDRKKGER